MKLFTAIAVLIYGILTAQAQTESKTWQPTAVKEPVQGLFHSPHAINLPTTETLQRGNLEVEISHRFLPPVNEGGEVFYGIDGPVNMRLALAYAVNNRCMIALGRSNVDDNVDLRLKRRLMTLKRKIPFQAALEIGAAYNSNPVIEVDETSRKMQYYSRLVLNTLIRERFAFGLVPAYLINPDLYTPESEHHLGLGIYGQLYLIKGWSLQAEWYGKLDGYQPEYRHNSLGFGIEKETYGHFFKIFLTNNALLNPGQYQGGADLAIDSGEWRLGFMITRLIQL